MIIIKTLENERFLIDSYLDRHAILKNRCRRAINTADILTETTHVHGLIDLLTDFTLQVGIRQSEV